MTRTTAILALLLAASSAYAHDPWTAADTEFELVGASLHSIDWGQTLSFTRPPGIVTVGNKTYLATAATEENPILGPRPTSRAVDIYFASTLAGHVAVAYLLPKPWRSFWQLAWIGVDGYSVGHNLVLRSGIHVPF